MLPLGMVGTRRSVLQIQGPYSSAIAYQLHASPTLAGRMPAYRRACHVLNSHWMTLARQEFERELAAKV